MERDTWEAVTRDMPRPYYSINGGPTPPHAARATAHQGGGWYNRRPTTLDQLRHFTWHTRKGKRHLLIVTARPESGAAAPWRIQYPLFISFSLPSWGLDSFTYKSCVHLFTKFR